MINPNYDPAKRRLPPKFGDVCLVAGFIRCECGAEPPAFKNIFHLPFSIFEDGGNGKWKMVNVLFKGWTILLQSRDAAEVNLAWWLAWTSNPVVVHRKVG